MNRKKNKLIMKSQRQLEMQNDPNFQRNYSNHNMRQNNDSSINYNYQKQNLDNSQVLSMASMQGTSSLPRIQIPKAFNGNPDMNYKQYTFKTGMSNIQNSFSLQHSSLIWSMPLGNRFPDMTYKGIDSFSYKPPSDFQDKYQSWNSKNNYGEGMQKGNGLGKGDRTDFTDPYKKYPSPFQYQRPLLSDKFAQKLFMQKQMNQQNSQSLQGLTRPYNKLQQ